MLTITRHEDGNVREREDRYGRIRVSESIRIVWRVSDAGDVIEDFDRLKDAKAKFPTAKLLKSTNGE